MPTGLHPAQPLAGDTKYQVAGSPLRVLQVHNAYQQRGGEDAVVHDEHALLLRYGHHVIQYQRHNDEVAVMGRMQLALDTVWSRRTAHDLAALLRTHQPDVVHVHNSFPLISPSLYWAAARAGVPVVQTLHNFRLICPQALLLREGRVCEDCVGKVPWRAVKHGCYRTSRTQSAAVATMVQTHRLLGTWDRKVALYIALNSFCRDKFIEGGLPAERIRVKPNFVDLPAADPGPRAGFLFVGRLSSEKGVDVLARAAARLPAGAQIKVAGTGPAAAQLAGSPGLHLLGALAPEQVYTHMSRALALVLPSIWYENFPRTLVEAFAKGLPVIASRLGAMASLVEDGRTGLLFNPGDHDDLASKLNWAHAHPLEMATMGAAARRYYLRHLTGDENHRQLVDIYGAAMASNVTEATS